jgi:hypothetical protein
MGGRATLGRRGGTGAVRWCREAEQRGEGGGGDVGQCARARLGTPTPERRLEEEEAQVGPTCKRGRGGKWRARSWATVGPLWPD